MVDNQWWICSFLDGIFIRVWRVTIFEEMEEVIKRQRWSWIHLTLRRLALSLMRPEFWGRTSGRKWPKSGYQTIQFSVSNSNTIILELTNRVLPKKIEYIYMKKNSQASELPIDRPCWKFSLLRNYKFFTFLFKFH